MNALLELLRDHLQESDLPPGVAIDNLSCVFVTPRFRTSSHIIIFVLDEKNRSPVLLAKVPRLPGDDEQLEREATNLRCAQQSREGGFRSIPRVIAFEENNGHRFLVESVVPGRPLRPDAIRLHPEETIQTTIDWLAEFQSASVIDAKPLATLLSSRVAEQLAVLDRFLPESGEERAALETTWAEIESLTESGLYTVFEHGDFSPPNILVDGDGNTGVVDWELAEPQGVPLTDVLFFLTSAAFARARASKGQHRVLAFQNAFYGKDPWACKFVRRFCERFGTDTRLVRSLMVLTWARYAANILTRLHVDLTPGSKEYEETLSWFRQNPYCAIWRYASREKLTHLETF
jgi:aminoglycoside phosphotransferase (APT) family kinase protein